MNVSVRAEYALLAIFDLTIHPQGTPVRIADIAKRQHIPQKFLELILAALKQGGFVESRRGAEGGYLLARPADSITIGEVVRFVDGGKGKSVSKRKADGPFHELWRRVDDAVSSVMDRTSFGDLARSWQDKQSRYVPNWDI